LMGHWACYSLQTIGLSGKSLSFWSYCPHNDVPVGYPCDVIIALGATANKRQWLVMRGVCVRDTSTWNNQLSSRNKNWNTPFFFAKIYCFDERKRIKQRLQ
jgi:hypothetical protein